MIAQSSLETHQQLWHKQHFSFFLSDSISLLSTSLYQSLCQSFLLTICLSIWIHTFSSNPFSLSYFSIPISHSSPSSHLLSYAVSSSVNLTSSFTATAPCFLHISFLIDSQYLHLQQSNSPVCCSASYHLFSFTFVPPPTSQPAFYDFSSDKGILNLKEGYSQI